MHMLGVMNSPLRLNMHIEKAAVPKASNTFELWFCGRSADRNKHHEGFPFFGQFQHALWITRIKFVEIDLRRRPQMFG